MIPLLDPAAWATVETPARVWALYEMILVGQVTYLTGAGTTGKSLLGQQLATCIALGLPLMGLETRQGIALYLTCEDDADELHRRQKPICEALGATLPQLSGKLYLGSLAGAIGNELSTFDPLGRMGTTPAWDRLRATALATRASFIVLDNVAHLFSGNENIRNQVAAFLSLLNGLAAETGAAILLIGHPNKAGDSFSGSTAWENQVRSRLFLKRPRDADGSILDPDARLLSKGKANYSRNGEALTFRWHRWALVREEDLPPNMAEQLTATIQANAENEAFLRCLAIATRDKQAVSHNRGTNYAPNIFAAMPEARKLSASSFERAMQRLRHIQQIRFDEPLWRGPNRVMKQGIKLASECTNRCTDPRTNPRTDPAPTPSDIEGGDCTDLHASTPLYPTGKSGPGLRAAGLDDEEGKAVGGHTILTAEHPNGRSRGSPILAPGESDDDPVPGGDEQEHGR